MRIAWYYIQYNHLHGHTLVLLGGGAKWHPWIWKLASWLLGCNNDILYSHSRGSSLSLKLLLLLTLCPLLLEHPLTTLFKWVTFVLPSHIVSSSSGPSSGVPPTTCTKELDPGLKPASIWSGCNRFSHLELSHGSEKMVCVSSLSLICEAQWWLLLG